MLEARPLLSSSVAETAVFVNTKGTRITPNRMGHQVRFIFLKAGITRRGSCHLFRHTMATQLLEAGCDVRYIQEMLGHSSLESTQIYTHVAANQLKAMHERYHPARLPKQAEASLAENAVPAPGSGSLNAPEAQRDACEPVPVASADLDAQAALLATLDAEALEES